MPEKRLLSIREFSEIYGPSRSATYELLASGELRRLKVGSRSFIPVEDAEAWRERLLDAAESSGAREVAR